MTDPLPTFQRERFASRSSIRLRRLTVNAQEITDTPGAHPPRTVRWAEAAHRAGFDGLAWTARLCNDSRAVVLFGDRAADAIEQDAGHARVLMAGLDLDWLIDTCAPLHVEVLPPQ